MTLLSLVHLSLARLEGCRLKNALSDTRVCLDVRKSSSFDPRQGSQETVQSPRVFPRLPPIALGYQ